MAAGPHLRHIPALDGRRGAAVAGVLLFQRGSLTGGSLGAFWARRARRLLPASAGLLVGAWLADEIVRTA